MRTMKLSDIVILEDRQRQEFEPNALMELTESIRDNGLLHAPVVREFNDDLVLVAGERRIKAMQDLWALGEEVRYDGHVIPEGYIPYTTLGELSVLEAEEAELDENLKRRDLTWQEHAAAVQRLHILRGAQKEADWAEELQEAEDSGEELESTLALALNRPKQTIAETALELTGRSDGAYQDAVRKEIIVAKHLHNPEVAKAKSVDEAFKILKRHEETARNIQLAADLGSSFTSASHTLLQGSCLDFMATTEEQFDVILTDPPYGMGADQFSDGGGKMTGIEHKYDDSYESWKKLMEAFCPLSYAIAKAQAHAYIFCDIDRFHELKALMQTAGWYVFRTPFTVFKLNSGRVPLPDRGPRRQSEWLLYAIKGNKPVTHIYPDVISCTGDENTSHGAQKSVSLFQNLLQRSVRPGDTVFDGFAGSGTIFPAAHLCKVKATACELTPEYFAIAQSRLAKLDTAGDLLNV